MPKPKLAPLSATPCAVCGKCPTDRAHIKSKGAGGTWDEENIIQLCRAHHTEQHKLGWRTFASRHLGFESKLRAKGWAFVEEFGVVKLRRV